jgi:transposase
MAFQKFSDDLKMRALFLCDHPEICENVAEVLGVSERSIQRWKANYDQHGTVWPPRVTKQGRPRILDDEKMEQAINLISATPDLYLNEIQDWVGIYVSGFDSQG